MMNYLISLLSMFVVCAGGCSNEHYREDGGYSLVGDTVFYRQKEVLNKCTSFNGYPADYKTFKIIDDYNAYDKDTIYYSGISICLDSKKFFDNKQSDSGKISEIGTIFDGNIPLVYIIDREHEDSIPSEKPELYLEHINIYESERRGMNTIYSIDEGCRDREIKSYFGNNSGDKISFSMGNHPECDPFEGNRKKLYFIGSESNGAGKLLGTFSKSKAKSISVTKDDLQQTIKDKDFHFHIDGSSYAIKNDKLLYIDGPIHSDEEINIKYLKTIPTSYYISGGLAYFGSNKLTNQFILTNGITSSTDLNSFKIVDSLYAYDKNIVYLSGLEICQSNPKTFFKDKIKFVSYEDIGNYIDTTKGISDTIFTDVYIGRQTKGYYSLYRLDKKQEAQNYIVYSFKDCGGDSLDRSYPLVSLNKNSNSNHILRNISAWDKIGLVPGHPDFIYLESVSYEGIRSDFTIYDLDINKELDKKYSTREDCGNVGVENSDGRRISFFKGGVNPEYCDNNSNTKKYGEVYIHNNFDDKDGKYIGTFKNARSISLTPSDMSQNIDDGFFHIHIDDQAYVMKGKNLVKYK